MCPERDVLKCTSLLFLKLEDTIKSVIPKGYSL